MARWRSRFRQEVLIPMAGRAARLLGAGLASPLVLLGSGRCGSTLLVSILESHSGMKGLPQEPNRLWHPAAYPYTGSRIQSPPIERDPEGFTRKSLAAWPPGQAGRIRAHFDGFRILEARGRTFFTKSAMISFMIPRILEIYPGARFIHVFRYGPSVAESYVEKNYDKYPEAAGPPDDYYLACCRYWNACILEIERARLAHRLDDRNAYFEVKYEEFCEDPRGGLDALAAFAGVDPAGFAYDISRVKSTNWKAKKRTSRPNWREAEEAMLAALRLKGYEA